MGAGLSSLSHEIAIEHVEARQLAAVHRRLYPSEIASAWRPALDQVWAYLRAHPGLRDRGHNIFVYRVPERGGPLEVDFGVEVTRRFEPEGDVAPTATPAGTVAWTTADAPAGIGEAIAAIDAWCAANGRTPAGTSWEIYGDPDPVTNTVAVQVCRLLA